MDREALSDLIIAEEGFRPAAYQDHLGYWTIGYGTLIDGRKGGGITREEAAYLLANRMNAYIAGLDSKMPWWRELSAKRRFALVQMAYQMGWDGLLGFRKMLEAMKASDFETAHKEALDSKWAKVDTPSRAHRVAEMILEG